MLSIQLTGFLKILILPTEIFRRRIQNFPKNLQDTPGGQIATSKRDDQQPDGKYRIANIATNELAKDVQNNSGFASLADIDVTAEGGQVSNGSVDQAISEVTV